MKFTNARKLFSVFRSTVFTVCWLLLAGITLEIVLTGCGSPNRTAYVVEGAVVNSADTATKVFLDLVVAGKVTTAQEVAYRAKYNKYFAAQQVVKELIITVQPGEKLDETALETATKAVSAASADLIAFVGQFSKQK